MISIILRTILSIIIISLGSVLYALASNWHLGIFKVWEAEELAGAMGLGLGFLIIPLLISLLVFLIVRKAVVGVFTGFGIIALLEWGAAQSGQQSHGLISVIIGGLTITLVILLWKSSPAPLPSQNS